MGLVLTLMSKRSIFKSYVVEMVVMEEMDRKERDERRETKEVLVLEDLLDLKVEEWSTLVGEGSPVLPILELSYCMRE